MKIFDSYNQKVEFKNKKLKDEEFIDLEFWDCKFIKCNFTGTIFEKCRFEDCVFIECNMSLVKPKYCSFVDVDFKNCKAIGINWAEAATPIHINFYSCTINSSSFFGLNISQIIMNDCSAKEVDFTEANLTRGNFNATNFLNSRFSKTNLTQSDFRNSINYDINPECNQLKKTRFSVLKLFRYFLGLISFWTNPKSILN
ncbi:MAG: pentapeptide repeat-containing protein [Desulfuromusa sp.]|nr:pentapeptide repeat-containing protein [Desulfuromusa sp.]